MPLPRKTPTPRTADKQPRTPKPHPAANLRDTWAAVAQKLTEVKATDAFLREPLTETLSHFLAGQYAIAINAAVIRGHIKPQTLAAFASDVAALRKGDQNAAWLHLERHRVGLEYKRLRLAMRDSHEKWKTKLTVAMEVFKKHLDDHPEARAAFAAFAEQVQKSPGMPPQTPPGPESPTKSA
jgi:hypothetical protein